MSKTSHPRRRIEQLEPASQAKPGTIIPLKALPNGATDHVLSEDEKTREQETNEALDFPFGIADLLAIFHRRRVTFAALALACFVAAHEFGDFLRELSLATLARDGAGAMIALILVVFGAYTVLLWELATPHSKSRRPYRDASGWKKSGAVLLGGGIVLFAAFALFSWINPLAHTWNERCERDNTVEIRERLLRVTAVDEARSIHFSFRMPD